MSVPKKKRSLSRLKAKALVKITYVRKKHFSEGNDEEIEFESGRIYIPQNSEMISYLGIT